MPGRRLRRTAWATDGAGAAIDAAETELAGARAARRADGDVGEADAHRLEDRDARSVRAVRAATHVATAATTAARGRSLARQLARRMRGLSLTTTRRALDDAARRARPLGRDRAERVDVRHPAEVLDASRNGWRARVAVVTTPAPSTAVRDVVAVDHVDAGEPRGEPVAERGAVRRRRAEHPHLRDRPHRATRGDLGERLLAGADDRHRRRRLGDASASVATARDRRGAQLAERERLDHRAQRAGRRRPTAASSGVGAARRCGPTSSCRPGRAASATPPSAWSVLAAAPRRRRLRERLRRARRARSTSASRTASTAAGRSTARTTSASVIHSGVSCHRGRPSAKIDGTGGASAHARHHERVGERSAPVSEGDGDGVGSPVALDRASPSGCRRVPVDGVDRASTKRCDRALTLVERAWPVVGRRALDVRDPRPREPERTASRSCWWRS